jgi:hypothetical protein
MATLTNHVFPAFSKRHSLFEKYGEISKESILFFEENTSASLLPELLVEFWREYGIGRFSHDLLYLCDPIKNQVLLSFFFPTQKLYPLVISSFGNIIFTDLENVYYLSVIYGWYKKHGSTFESLFEILLKRDDYLDGAFDEKFHVEVTKKLGKLEPDQIFGFEPAIALGGNDEDINMVKKFQMDAHLAFLSQLVELEER